MRVATFNSSVVEEEGQEDRVTVDVKERKLMMCNEWFCK